MLAVASAYQKIHFKEKVAQTKSFGRAFSKARRAWGSAPRSAGAGAKQSGGLFCGENPRRGFSHIAISGICFMQIAKPLSLYSQSLRFARRCGGQPDAKRGAHRPPFHTISSRCEAIRLCSMQTILILQQALWPSRLPRHRSMAKQLPKCKCGIPDQALPVWYC